LQIEKVFPIWYPLLNAINLKFMSQIGTLITGAGIATVIAGQSQCEQYLLIGDVDTANPLQGIQVEIDGVTFININASATLIAAFAKWQSESTGATIGGLIKLATGVVKKNTTIRLTNAGATVPAIYAFSEADNGIPLMASTKTVNPTSYDDFERFSAIFLGTPANIASLEIVFADGRKSTMTVQEADALFNLYNQTETDGRLGGITVIDNTSQNIRAVRVNTNATAGGCAVLMAKLPDSAFKMLNGN
jgi:hypothetical protein